MGPAARRKPGASARRAWTALQKGAGRVAGPPGAAPWGGPRGGARLDRAKILTERDRSRVDTVHETLVVGDGSEWIELGKSAGPRDRRRQLGAAQRVFRHVSANAYSAPQRQVRQNTQSDSTAQELVERRGQGFRHRIDHVCAHRFAHVDVNVKDDHAGLAFEHAQLEIPTASAALDHSRDGSISKSKQLLAPF